MRKYFNFVVTAVILVLFIFLLSKTTIINGDAIFLQSYKYVLYSGIAFIIIVTIIDQIIDREYKVFMNILTSVYIAPLIVNFNDTSSIVMNTLVFSIFYIIIFFRKTFMPKEKTKLILPPGTYRKSQYYGLLITLTLLCFLDCLVFFALDKWYFKLLAFAIALLLLFGLIIIYQVIAQFPMMKAHKNYILTGDYNRLKSELNNLKQDYLHKETINQINLILINYGIDKDIIYVDELVQEVFKPTLVQYSGLYSQTMATYYLNKHDYNNARPLIGELKNSTNEKLNYVGKRFDVAIKLELKEDVSLTEIDELADYSNAINSLATYQMYAKFYETRDYNKYIEYINKINQVKNYVK